MPDANPGEEVLCGDDGMERIHRVLGRRKTHGQREIQVYHIGIETLFINSERRAIY